MTVHPEHPPKSKSLRATLPRGHLRLTCKFNAQEHRSICHHSYKHAAVCGRIRRPHENPRTVLITYDEALEPILSHRTPKRFWLLSKIPLDECLIPGVQLPAHIVSEQLKFPRSTTLEVYSDVSFSSLIMIPLHSPLERSLLYFCIRSMGSKTWDR